MTRFQTLWIQMRKNKPLDESPKSDQTSGMKMVVYSKYNDLEGLLIKNTYLAIFEPFNQFKSHLMIRPV
ncbi:hypothetical protein Hanom_Chr09g00833521 [Helianthus anomalus]